MGNSLSKFDDKPLTLHVSPLTADRLRNEASGIRNNPVKYFASGIHRDHGDEEFTQGIESSFIDIYDSFPPQSFEL